MGRLNEVLELARTLCITSLVATIEDVIDDVEKMSDSSDTASVHHHHHHHHPSHLPPKTKISNNIYYQGYAGGLEQQPGVPQHISKKLHQSEPYDLTATSTVPLISSVTVPRPLALVTDSQPLDSIAEEQPDDDSQAEPFDLTPKSVPSTTSPHLSGKRTNFLVDYLM